MNFQLGENSGGKKPKLFVMKIQLLTASEFPVEQLKALLKKYNLEDFYLKSVKTDFDLDEFIDFKVSNIRNRVQNGCKVWQVIDVDNNVIAIFGLQKSEPRSKNFGLNYYEFNPFFNFTKDASKAFTLFEKEVLDKEIRESKIEYLKAKVNASDYCGISTFCKSDYTFIGTSMNLYLKKQDFKRGVKLPENLEVIPMEENMIDALKAILMQHNHNEDFYDIDIEDNKTYENFFNWLENYYLTDSARKNNNTDIILLFDKNANEIVGFSCYTKESGFSRRFGLNLITRDLTIIPEKHHGKGYGHILFSEIMKREDKNVELKLMSNNYKAIRFNHSNGFKSVGSAHFFRKLLKMSAA